MIVFKHIDIVSVISDQSVLHVQYLMLNTVQWRIQSWVCGVEPPPPLQQEILQT